MKKEPNDLDREAAKLFKAAGGMRYWTRRFVDPQWDRLPEGFDPSRPRTIGERVTAREIQTHEALDTDDGPTKGAMLDQIRADRNDAHVSVQWIDGQWCVCAGPVGQFSEFLGTGPTEGAALVDAKKAKDQP